MKPILLAAVVCLTAQAQIFVSQARPNADGSRTLFLSAMRLAGTDQPLLGKIFEAGSGGVHLVLALPPSHSIASLHASADGGIIAYSTRAECGASASCLAAAASRWTIQTRDGRVLWEGSGSVRVSANGRYALAIEDAGIFRIGIHTGERTMISAGAPNEAAIGDSGQVLLQYGGTAVHYITSIWQNISNAGNAILSGDGNVVAFRRLPGAGFAVRDMRNEREISLPGAPRAMNSDGTRILYEAEPNSDRREMAIFDTSRETSCVLFGLFPASNEAALSDDGKVAVFITQSGVRRMECGDSEPAVIAQIPVGVSPVMAEAVPGSLGSVFIQRAPLLAVRSAEPPLPQELGGYRVLVNGRAVPLLALSTSRFGESLTITFQFPWDMQATNERIMASIQAPFSSPFEAPASQVAQFVYSAFRPRFNYDDIGVVGYHQELDRRVTREDPARAGEIVHLFATGLGAVDREVGTGQAAPSDPPAKPLDSMHCDGEVESVLAPGMVGVYKVSVRVPASESGVFISIGCRGASVSIPYSRGVP